MKRLVFSSVCLLLISGSLRAGIFTVTTNADSGPGSFRDALTKCAANGTGIRDSILFSIPDNSLAGRTITLLSELPRLTSNMVIDGTTQTGDVIGVSDARVLLFLNASTGIFSFLRVYDCNDVGIYGIGMISTVVDNYLINKVNGISYVRCHNLQIGKAGAGNYILGCTSGIYSNTTRYGNYVYSDTSRQLTIQSNIIGLDLAGGFSNMYKSKPLQLTYYSLFIISTADLLIGGDNPEDGNTIIYAVPDGGYSVLGVNIDIETCRDTDNGLMKIKNNKLGTRKDGSLDPDYGSIPVFIDINGNFRTDYDFSFIDNILRGQLAVSYLGRYFTIQGNTFFSTRPNTLYDFAITIHSCFGGGIIGGDLPGESNTFTNAYTDSIYYFKDNSWEQGCIRFDIDSHVTIRNNVTVCNSYHSSTFIKENIYVNYYGGAYVRIDSTAVNFVRGKAAPNNRIDVYLDDDCLACEGKKYLGFTMANADSTWQYTGVFNSTVVATGTSTTTAQTSTFSAPEIIDYDVIIKQPTCGKNNGSIKGLQISGGDNVKWHLMRQVNGVWTDSIYATTLDIENAGAGIYFFDAWLGKTCRSYYKRFDLSDASPKIDTSQIVIEQPACGLFNGSIKNLMLSTYQDIMMSWQNISGTIIGNESDLINAGPGKYRLIIRDSITGCADSTRFYDLISQSGPSVNINAVQIKPAVCGQPNGSITGVVVSNITGTPVFNWYDSTYDLVGTGAALLNVPPGTYLLKFKDESSCDTITTPFFTISNSGLIQFDTTNRIIIPSKCAAATGGIKNIIAANGYTYRWINAITGQVVSLNKDLSDVASGYYKLTAFSFEGCMDSTKSFYIPQVAPGELSISSTTVTPETCNRKDGSAIVAIAGNTAGFGFAWIDSNSNTTISTSLNLQNVAAGNYLCYATDSNACSYLFTKAHIANLPAPVIVTGSEVLKPDACMQQNGAITQVSIQGSSPFSYAWYNNNAQIVSQTKDLVDVSAGIYYLIVSDANKCNDTSALFNVAETSIPLQPPIYDEVTILKGSTADLVVKNPAPGKYALYGSFTGIVPQQINVNGAFVIGPLNSDTTVYILFEAGNCKSDLTPVQIKVVEAFDLYMPNAFSPNNDYLNDVFGVKYPNAIKSFEMKIYNRFGQRIFSSNDAGKGWDGTVNGTPQPQDFYVWTIKYTDITGKSKKLSGQVLLLR